MKKMLRSFVVICIVILIISTDTLHAGEREIKIGVITDLSGPVSYWGSQSRIGAEIAEEEINNNNDVKLKVIFGDHKFSTKTAVSEAQKLIYIDNVDALYSENTSTSIAVASFVKKLNLLMLYSAAAESPVKTSENFYKTYLNYSDGCRLTAEYFKKQGITKVGVLKATMEFGDLCLRGVRQVYSEFEVVEYNAGDDVATQALLFKSKEIEAVFNATYESDLVNMLKAMSSIKYMPKVVINSDAFSGQVAKQFPTFTSSIYLFGFSPITKTFLEQVKAKFPENSFAAIEAAALAYTHIKQLYYSVKDCPKKDLACQKDRLNHAGHDGTIGFQAWHDRVAEFKIGVYQRKNDGLVEVTTE